jgi:hypothetical protein
MGIDSRFPSVQEGHFVKVDSGERQEAHQRHVWHNRKFIPLSVLFVVLSPVSILPDMTSAVFFLKIVCSSSNNKWRFTKTNNRLQS